MKLLLAVDGSACSEAAAREVARRPWPAGTEVKLLSVIEPPFTPTTETWVLPDSYYTQMEKAGREQAHAAIGTALKHLRAGSNSPLEVLTAVVEGYPKDTILDEAQKWGADLIILGSHADSGRPGKPGSAK